MVLLTSLIFGFGGLPRLLAGQPSKNTVSPEALKEIKRPSRLRLPECPDLKANMDIRKREAGGSGIVELHGQVCNAGNTDFASRTAAGVRASLSAYNPAIAGSGAYEYLASRDFTSLAKGACVDMNAAYTINDLIRWGHTTPASGQCEESRIFAVFINSNVPDEPGFSEEEDCYTGNNYALKDVGFMIECLRQ